MLKEACQFYQKLSQQRGDDHVLSLATGRAHSRLGDVLELQGEYDRAEQSYRQAMVILAGPMDVGSDVDRRREQARAVDGLGVLLKKIHRSGESEALARGPGAPEAPGRSAERSGRPPSRERHALSPGDSDRASERETERG